jgi:hypothetical protein
MAVVHGEAVLRQRICLGQGCHAVFFICTHCDRGHRYCSTNAANKPAASSGGAPTGATNRVPKGGSIIAIGSRRTGAACVKRNRA